MNNWPLACRNAFAEMAANNPDSLIEWINSKTLGSGHLTFAAEELKNIHTSKLVVDTLITLSNHKEAVVREGAVYGMYGHLNDSQVVKRLLEMAYNDSSIGVKQAAKDILDLE